MDPRRAQGWEALMSLLEEDPVLLLEKAALSSHADTLLHVAIDQSILAAETDFVKEMLLRMPNFARELNRDGFSPLHTAAAMHGEHGDHQRASFCPGGTALCLVKDKLGQTPLHYRSYQRKG